MISPLLIIVSGPPCSGKTTLARRLAGRLNLPFIYKDGIKELLFNRLGTGDLEWSSLLSLASYDLLYYFAEAQLKAGRSLVVEANFRPEKETAKFLALKEKYEFIPFQIQCHTEGQVLLERFRRRAESSERHPGHLDRSNEPNLQAILLGGRHEPLDIGGSVFEIDTTDFDAIDYEGLFAAFADLRSRA
jgi:predicted kinase